MQLATCTVKHAGKHYASIRRSNVTPAELTLLEQIHGGKDAVRDVVFAGDVERSVAEEMTRLNALYGSKEEIKQMIAQTFPGARPNLPMTLADAGYDVDCTAAPQPKVEPKEGEIIKPPVRHTLKARGAEAALA